MKLHVFFAQPLAACVLAAFTGAIAAQQGYPSKAIRFILPTAPGGSNSFVARLVGQKPTDSWGFPVIVDNRPGSLQDLPPHRV